MSKYIAYLLLFLVGAAIILALLVYSVPQVYDRLAWHVDNIRTQIKYALNPPEQVVFIPATLTPNGGETPTATLLPSPTPFLADDTATPQPSATPQPTKRPLPPAVTLSGFRYEDQHGLWNYCAPANLSVLLSFWGWKGDRVDVGQKVKPYNKDKNVFPYELAEFVANETDLNVIVRVGGDLETLKRFLAAGFPVLVEKGTWLRDYTGVVSWMGHYQVITGYDDTKGIFIAQDTYVRPDLEVAAENLLKDWRAFNYAYLVAYPAGTYNDVMTILGADADVDQNILNAALRASNEIVTSQGVDQFFAWFNRGESLAELQDYGGAASAFDEAFAMYPTIPEDQRPWRIMWYRTGPYKAYFGVGRYYDVINLADTTLNSMSDPILEESYFWRARAKWELGDQQGAIEDFRQSLKYHPGFGPTLYWAEIFGLDLGQ